MLSNKKPRRREKETERNKNGIAAQDVEEPMFIYFHIMTIGSSSSTFLSLLASQKGA